eukprot:Skav201820  [mRNA]  locus=scaffold1071:360201:361737:- [translate_table: standard]
MRSSWPLASVGLLCQARRRVLEVHSLDDFVEAATSFWLDTGVREQIRSLRRGLHDVLGPCAGALWLFSPDEPGSQAMPSAVEHRSSPGDPPWDEP